MDAFVNKLCKAYLLNHPYVLGFGPEITYDGFDRFVENRDVPLGATDLRRTFVHGRINYRVASGQIRHSGQLLVKYFDSLQQAAGVPHGFASFAREMAFFRRLVPALARVKPLSGLPKLCASRVSGTGSDRQEVILFDCPAGVVDVACSSFLRKSHLLLMIRLIAELHVAYWLARRVDPAFWTEEERVHLPYAQPERILPLLKRCFQSIDEIEPNAIAHAQAKERLRHMLDDFDERLRAPFDPASRNACWTLCHQSYSQNNVVFEFYEYELFQMRIFNWQSMGFASLGVDLVIGLFVEQKRHREKMVPLFIREYLEALHEIPVAERPTLEAINAEIKRCVPVALYVLAFRVERASSQIQPDSLLFPASCWNERLIINLFKYLITSEYV